jgi:ribonuclease P protein component
MPPQRHPYPKSHRLSGRLNFAAVRNQGLKDSRGPLVFYALPNQLSHCRLGIGIGRHCGNAVLRNRVKRLLREAFRLLPADSPSGYDLLISVRPHQPLHLAEYQKIFSSALFHVHAAWLKRKL